MVDVRTRSEAGRQFSKEAVDLEIILAIAVTGEEGIFLREMVVEPDVEVVEVLNGFARGRATSYSNTRSAYAGSLDRAGV
jgi:hypothetical protein